MQLPQRKLYENLALIIFMTVLFILSLLQNAAAQGTEGSTIRPTSLASREFNSGLDSLLRDDNLVSIRLASYIQQHNRFTLRSRMGVIRNAEPVPGTGLVDNKPTPVNALTGFDAISYDPNYDFNRALKQGTQSYLRDETGTGHRVGSLIGAVAGAVLGIATAASGSGTKPSAIEAGFLLLGTASAIASSSNRGRK